MKLILYMLAGLAVISTAGAMDQADGLWWSMAGYSIVETAGHMEGAAYPTSRYSQYDHIMSMREAAQMTLNASLNMTVSNDSAEAKSIFEAGLRDLITGTKYSEAVYGCGDDLACMRSNGKTSGDYYGNYTVAVIKTEMIFDDITASDPY